MPQQDRSTKIANAVNERRRRMAEAIERMNEIGLGKDRLTKREFRSKIRTDEDFRAGMAEEMGGETLARFMTQEESNGN